MSVGKEEQDFLIHKPVDKEEGNSRLYIFTLFLEAYLSHYLKFSSLEVNL